MSSRKPEVNQWVESAQSGDLSWSELAERLLQLEHGAERTHQPDLDRPRRCGLGEVIYGSGKSVDDIASIAGDLLAAGQSEVLVTRVSGEKASSLSDRFSHLRYDSQGRTLRISKSTIDVVNRSAIADRPGDDPTPAPIAVVTAGSTDLPVAIEALETLRWMGIDADLLTDVGVAGPYRLVAHVSQLRSCVAVVVVAGMEGALASVVGGLVPCPVIAVPTSVGYGANLEGVTTLLGMLSSCSAAVTVVNIDAGFKGGYVAGLIAHQIR